MFRPDSSRLSPEEKDALILALLDRVAALEAKLARPPKTPDNSSVPPSRGRKANRPPRPKKPRRKRDGPGVTRQLAAAADHVVDSHARACMHCGAVVSAAGQVMRHAYDLIDLPPIRPVVTRVRIFGRPALPGLPAAGAGGASEDDAAELTFRPVNCDHAGLSAPSPRGWLSAAVQADGRAVRPVDQRGRHCCTVSTRRAAAT